MEDTVQRAGYDHHFATKIQLRTYNLSFLMKWDHSKIKILFDNDLTLKTAILVSSMFELGATVDAFVGIFNRLLKFLWGLALFC